MHLINHASRLYSVEGDYKTNEAKEKLSLTEIIQSGNVKLFDAFNY